MHRTLVPLLLVLLGGACQSARFRAIVVPDPVPRDVRTGNACFVVRLTSRVDEDVTIGLDGPILRARGTIDLPRDLPPRVDIDEIHVLRDESVLETLRVPVRSFTPDVAGEAAIALPDLGGHEVRVTAGFHSATHRRPGHRHALDLVPELPAGRSAFGTRVLAPFAGTALAVSLDHPDRPGGRPNELVVRADDGRVYRYSHFQRGSIRLRPDERFEKGALLGNIGLSGETSGPHLHVELFGQAKRGATRRPVVRRETGTAHLHDEPLGSTPRSRMTMCPGSSATKPHSR